VRDEEPDIRGSVPGGLYFHRDGVDPNPQTMEGRTSPIPPDERRDDLATELSIVWGNSFRDATMILDALYVLFRIHNKSAIEIRVKLNPPTK
jgi:hypothetical protein